MIHRKLGACAALFFGLALAGSAIAADASVTTAPVVTATQTPNSTLATKVPPMDHVFAQMAKNSHSAFVSVTNDCEHVSTSNFCQCYPEACHN